jgi:hypothetical protein
MTNTSIKILFFLLLYLLTNEAKSQLIADAGHDTIFCITNREESTIGGTPTAKGGIPPYNYKWSSKLQIGHYVLYASTFLNDTSIANPSFKDYHDTLSFFLEVTDSIGSIARDSVTIIFSQFIYCLGECISYIYQGDSIQLYHCVGGGIPPYSYFWSPEESLSDATISNPWAKPETTTIYGLVITDSAGCEAASSCNVFVYPVNIDNHYLINRYIKIYPNPIYSIAYIFTENSDFNNLKFEILNLNGILVREIKITGRVTPFSVTGLKSGLFLYRLISDDKEIDAGKILIQPFYTH